MTNVLFITDDDVEIHEDDICYFVYDDFSMDFGHGDEIPHHHPSKAEIVKRFSTEFAAKGWIAENKPTFSKKDVRIAMERSWGVCGRDSILKVDEFMNSLNLE